MHSPGSKSTIWDSWAPLVALIATLALLGCDDGVSSDTDGGAGPDGGETPSTIEELLDQIDWITIENHSQNGDEDFFVLSLTQPLDHGSSSTTGDFQQRAWLRHKAQDAPVVIVTEGYDLPDSEDYLCEPTQLLGANQLVVEHRYFGQSAPEQLDWSFLTIEQAAEDHHRIITALKDFYQDPWISFGTSKGGQAALVHRSMYPDDVDGTVAYVTPFPEALEDPQFATFLQQVGTQECRDSISDFQLEVLSRRASMEAMTQSMATTYGYTFSRFPIPQALEYAVIELDFSYWMRRGIDSCDTIPDSTAGNVDVFNFLNDACPVPGYADEYQIPYDPYGYQLNTELGYFAPNWAHLTSELLYANEYHPTTYLPEGATAEFDNTNFLIARDWVEDQGHAILLVYGEYDPWTAAALNLDSATDSGLFIVPEGNHSSTISKLSSDDQEAAHELLEMWTGIAIQ